MKKTLLVLACILIFATNAIGLAEGTHAGSGQIMVGDILSLGSYEQDGNEENGREPIEWEVIDRAGNYAMLVSVKGLESAPYHGQKKRVTWQGSTIRSWLNNSFLYSAFTETEQSAILDTKVSNSTWEGNTEWTTTEGKHTIDKLYLLSYSEVQRYFANRSHRVIQVTRHVENEDPIVRRDGAWWWLRSAGSTQKGAAVVRPDGSLGQARTVDNPHGVVRPVMWIDLGKI